MASYPIWPTTLPQSPVLDGYKESMPSNLIRSNTDTGPAKVRRRGNAKPISVNATYILNTEEVKILDRFVDETLGGAAMCFDWPRPKYNYVRARLVASDSGIYTKTLVSNTNDFWSVTLNLEIFPDVPTLS